MSELTIGYWSIRGLGAPLRMMAMYKNVPVRCECYDRIEKEDGGFDSTAWFSGAKTTLKESNCLINLPYVKDGDIIVAQTNACFQYLGRKLGMLGTNERELIDCEQLLCEVMDLRNKVVSFSYGRDQNPQKWFQSVAAAGQLEKLNLWLERKYATNSAAATFFVGEDATAPDFHIWEMMDQLQLIARYFQISPDPLAEFPHLVTFHKNFASLPQNARYLSSRLAKLPCNAVFASTFGGTPTGDAFQPGQVQDWIGASGVY